MNKSFFGGAPLNINPLGPSSTGPAGGAYYFKFTTRNTSGVPTTLGGSPAVSVYKDNSTTQSTSGVTLIADFDGVVGLNHVTIDTSADATFYANGSHYELVITTGTVGGTSVVGEDVGSFDLAASTAAPTAADIWAYATRTLTALPAIPDGWLTAAGIASVALNGKGDWSTLTASGVWLNATRTLSAGTNIVLTKGIGVTGFTDLDAAGVRSAVGLASANLDAQLGALPLAAEVADKLLGRNIAGGSDGGRTIAEAMAFLRNKWEISGGTLIVYAANDSTTLWTATVATTAGNPVTAVDPS